MGLRKDDDDRSGDEAKITDKELVSQPVILLNCLLKR